MRRAVGTAVASLVLLVGVPGLAQAAQRYAAPGGSGVACTKAQPCSLAEAIGGAKTNDEVIITAGSYSTGAAIVAPFGVENLYVHGDFGGPMPTISTAAAFSPPIWIQGIGGRIGYVDAISTGLNPVGLFCPPEGRVDRVRTNATGDFSIGLVVSSGCIARDSVLQASGKTAVALLGIGQNGKTGFGRNLTAIAAGPESTAVRSSYNEIFIKGSYTLNLANVIASGETSDLDAGQGIEGPGHIVVSNSNFDVAVQKGSAKISGSANQTAPPLFVDAAGGDFRQAPGSPTIDAGSTDGIGALDLEGNARNLGAAPDIGAFEFVPPPAPVAAAGTIQSLSLKPKAFRTLNGGGAIFSKKAAPVGTTVTYFVSAPVTVEFTVERATTGRKVGRKCKKATPANRDKKRCPLFRALKPSFTHPGIHNGVVAGNSFKFSGRIGGKALRPGRYRLAARTGDSVKRATFRIVGANQKRKAQNS
jgi:hypothetical protein